MKKLLSQNFTTSFNFFRNTFLAVLSLGVFAYSKHIDLGPDVYLVDGFIEQDSVIATWKYNPVLDRCTGVKVFDQNGKLNQVVQRPDTFLKLPKDTKKFSVEPVYKEGPSTPIVVNLSEASSVQKLTGRIGVYKNEKDNALFFDRYTGKKFMPFGYNYIPLRKGDHSMFDAQTEISTANYNPYHAESVIRLLKKYGYNTIRVFLAGRSQGNPGYGGSPATEGLYIPYLNNLADFLARCGRHNVYVIFNFCDMDLPSNDYFRKLSPKGLHSNPVTLTKEGVQGSREMVGSTLSYLKSVEPELLKVILGVQFNNEASVQLAAWPLTEKEPVAFSDGKTYKFEDSTSVLQAVENGWLSYYSQLISVVKKVDRNLMTCEGVFVAGAVGRSYQDLNKVNDKNYLQEGFGWEQGNKLRCPPSIALLARTELDFLDIHLYPYFKDPTPSLPEKIDTLLNTSLFDQAVNNGLLKKKPIILGEFGAFKVKGKAFQEASDYIREIARYTMAKKGFSGWLFWSLETFDQQEIYQALAYSEGFLKEMSHEVIVPETKLGSVEKNEVIDKSKISIEKIDSKIEKTKKSYLVRIE